MTLALEVVALHKRFAAGAGSCLATHSVLRGVDLELGRGEVAAIAGTAGSGRSTLLLCVAGLLTPDHGTVRRFGEESREGAARRTRYYMNWEQLRESAPSGEPTVHLVDLCDFPALQLSRLVKWLTEQKRRGDSALVATDSAEVGRHLSRRVLTLGEGVVHEVTRVRGRVAEAHFVDRPFERV